MPHPVTLKKKVIDLNNNIKQIVDILRGFPDILIISDDPEKGPGLVNKGLRHLNKRFNVRLLNGGQKLELPEIKAMLDPPAKALYNKFVKFLNETIKSEGLNASDAEADTIDNHFVLIRELLKRMVCVALHNRDDLKVDGKRMMMIFNKFISGCSQLKIVTEKSSGIFFAAPRLAPFAKKLNQELDLWKSCLSKMVDFINDLNGPATITSSNLKYFEELKRRIQGHIIVHLAQAHNYSGHEGELSSEWVDGTLSRLENSIIDALSPTTAETGIIMVDNPLVQYLSIEELNNQIKVCNRLGKAKNIKIVESLYKLLFQAQALTSIIEAIDLSVTGFGCLAFVVKAFDLTSLEDKITQHEEHCKKIFEQSIKRCQDRGTFRIQLGQMRMDQSTQVSKYSRSSTDSLRKSFLELDKKGIISTIKACVTDALTKIPKYCRLLNVDNILSRPITMSMVTRPLQILPKRIDKVSVPNRVGNRKSLAVSEKNLNALLLLPKSCLVGKAFENSGAFFDAFAQSYNALQNDNHHNELSLRKLCWDYYMANDKQKAEVREWHNNDFGGIDRGDEYAFVQYTKKQLDNRFYGKASIGGRAHIDGVILCRQLKLKVFYLIKLIKDSYNEHNLIANYFEITGYGMRPMGSNKQTVDFTRFPCLVVSQNDLHFVPILPKNYKNIHTDSPHNSAQSPKKRTKAEKPQSQKMVVVSDDIQPATEKDGSEDRLVCDTGDGKITFKETQLPHDNHSGFSALELDRVETIEQLIVAIKKGPNKKTLRLCVALEAQHLLANKRLPEAFRCVDQFNKYNEAFNLLNQLQQEISQHYKRKTEYKQLIQMSPNDFLTWAKSKTSLKQEYQTRITESKKQLANNTRLLGGCCQKPLFISLYLQWRYLVEKEDLVYISKTATTLYAIAELKKFALELLQKTSSEKKGANQPAQDSIENLTSLDCYEPMQDQSLPKKRLLCVQEAGVPYPYFHQLIECQLNAKSKPDKLGKTAHKKELKHLRRTLNDVLFKAVEKEALSLLKYFITTDPELASKGLTTCLALPAQTKKAIAMRLDEPHKQWENQLLRQGMQTIFLKIIDALKKRSCEQFLDIQDIRRLKSKRKKAMDKFLFNQLPVALKKRPSIVWNKRKHAVIFNKNNKYLLFPDEANSYFVCHDGQWSHVCLLPLSSDNQSPFKALGITNDAFVSVLRRATEKPQNRLILNKEISRVLHDLNELSLKSEQAETSYQRLVTWQCKIKLQQKPRLLQNMDSYIRAIKGELKESDTKKNIMNANDFLNALKKDGYANQLRLKQLENVKRQVDERDAFINQYCTTDEVREKYLNELQTNPQCCLGSVIFTLYAKEQGCSLTIYTIVTKGHHKILQEDPTMNIAGTESRLHHYLVNEGDSHFSHWKVIFKEGEVRTLSNDYFNAWRARFKEKLAQPQLQPQINMTCGTYRAMIEKKRVEINSNQGAGEIILATPHEQQLLERGKKWQGEQKRRQLIIGEQTPGEVQKLREIKREVPFEFDAIRDLAVLVEQPRNQQNHTLLYAAVSAKKTNIITFLLTQGASMVTRCGTGKQQQFPLKLVAEQEGFSKYYHKLLQYADNEATPQPGTMSKYKTLETLSNNVGRKLQVNLVNYQHEQQAREQNIISQILRYLREFLGIDLTLQRAIELAEFYEILIRGMKDHNYQWIVNKMIHKSRNALHNDSSKLHSPIGLTATIGDNWLKKNADCYEQEFGSYTNQQRKRSEQKLGSGGIDPRIKKHKKEKEQFQQTIIDLEQKLEQQAQRNTTDTVELKQQAQRNKTDTAELKTDTTELKKENKELKERLERLERLFEQSQEKQQNSQDKPKGQEKRSKQSSSRGGSPRYFKDSQGEERTPPRSPRADEKKEDKSEITTSSDEISNDTSAEQLDTVSSSSSQ